jgi:hypothetical protein
MPEKDALPATWQNHINLSARYFVVQQPFLKYSFENVRQTLSLTSLFDLSANFHLICWNQSK